MAKKPSTPPARNDGWQAKGFVNLSLTETQAKTALKLYGEEGKFERDLDTLMREGYRFTISYDARTDAYVCSCNCKDPSSENNGWLLTSFAPTYPEAMVLTLYKHVYVLEGSWVDVGHRQPAARYG